MDVTYLSPTRRGWFGAYINYEDDDDDDDDDFVVVGLLKILMYQFVSV